MAFRDSLREAEVLSMRSVALPVGFLLMICAGFAQPIPPSLSITTPPTLPAGFTVSLYSQTLAAAYGALPYTWQVTSGGLPAGLALSSAGVIAGIPTTVGTVTFSVTVTDALLRTASQTFTLAIRPGPPPFAITTPSTLPSGLAGASYSQTLAAIGGVPPYTWSATSGALPVGLAISSAGVIAGIPTVAGTSTFSVTLTDASPVHCRPSSPSLPPG